MAMEACSLRPPSLTWLPRLPDATAAVRTARDAGASWAELVRLARHDLDMLATDRLAGLIGARFADGATVAAGTRPLRLLALGTATISQLASGIAVGGLRRGLHVAVRIGAFGEYLASTIQAGSPLDAWAPTHVLFCFDARSATGRIGEADGLDEAARRFVDHVARAWAEARDRFGDRTSILQALVLPVLPRLLGSNERRYGISPAALIERINAALAERAEAAGVDLIDPASISTGHDPATWYDAVLWHKARQEVSPVAAPLFGDLVARVLAAQAGRVAKCLVLDLDNTIWGGVIGDDGLEGIVLGQGSAEGEAFLAVQDYARALSRRGVILAVCSKNDQANAILPFREHPDMLLRRDDIAAFVANWNDKASNLRAIAAMLNLGLDALVFVDDDPFERNQVRDALPEVFVPEVPDDPALVPACLADSGLFEAIVVTGDDLARRAQYPANDERLAALEVAGDLGSYRAGLAMVLSWRCFRALDHERTVQLVNKTNQFNLTTRRYTGPEIEALRQDRQALGLTFRLRDAFGDNGLVAVIVARLSPDGGSASIDTWLMSCRVLGRGVENACLDVLATLLRRRGIERLIGEYVPSPKNAMVRSHYARLGFRPLDIDPETGAGTSELVLDSWAPSLHPVTVEGDE